MMCFCATLLLAASALSTQSTVVVASPVDLVSIAAIVERVPLASIQIVEPRRPAALVPLYAAFAALQAYDVHSTIKALGSGAAEANPVMRGLAKNRAALISIKGAVTVSSIFVAERLWRANHRKAAVALMVVTAGMMAIVAANNARVLRQLR